MAWTTKTGIECRATSAYVTNDSGDTQLEADGSSNLLIYPQSRTVNSNTFNIGYSSGAEADGGRNRTTGVGSKLAGMHFKASGTATLQMQIGDAAGDYKVWAGFSDQTNGTGGTVGFTLRDSNGTITSQTGLTALGSSDVYDINGTLYSSAANWAATADTTGTSYTFTTSDTTNGNGGPFIYLDFPDSNTRLAYIAFQYLGSGTPIAAISHYYRMMHS